MAFNLQQIEIIFEVYVSKVLPILAVLGRSLPKFVLFTYFIKFILYSIEFFWNEVKFALCSVECKFKIKRTKPNFHRIFPKLVAQIYNVLNCTFQFDYPAITFHLILKL